MGTDIGVLIADSDTDFCRLLSDILGAMTRELYPAAARPFSVTPQRVERDIRCATEIAWRRCGPDARAAALAQSRAGRAGRRTASLLPPSPTG